MSELGKVEKDFSKSFGVRVLDPIRDHLKKHGVNNYIILAGDPDDQTSWDVKDGSDYWIIGAMEVLQRKMIKDNLESERTEL